jgi:hypothetical protein
MTTEAPPRFGIKIVAISDQLVEGLRINDEYEEGDVWLAAYDPDGNDGAGYFDFTLDPSEALSFTNAADATMLWRQVSTTRPVRLDGKPNRPLSAFTIAVEKVPC